MKVFLSGILSKIDYESNRNNPDKNDLNPSSGKVMKKIMKRSLLSFQIERLFVIATTTNKEDYTIVELAQKVGIGSCRGS